jgi:hypothetical protein
MLKLKAKRSFSNYFEVRYFISLGQRNKRFENVSKKIVKAI